jgi:hypothetical protein
VEKPILGVLKWRSPLSGILKSIIALCAHSAAVPPSPPVLNESPIIPAALPPKPPLFSSDTNLSCSDENRIRLELARRKNNKESSK